MTTSPLNPSITSPRSGARGRGKSPLDTTGRTYAAQHAEQEARKHAEQELASLDLDAVKRAEYKRGYLDGFEQSYQKGLEAGWDTLAEHLVAEGILAPDEPADAGKAGQE